MRDDELETTLRDIGRRLAYPEPTRIDAAVRERIRADRVRPPWWRTFAPAFATAAVLLIVVAVAFPGVRGAAEEFLHLRGIDIFRVQNVPTTAPSLPITIPGERVTLDEARSRVHFAIRVPSDPRLAKPDEVYADTSGTAERVTLVYRDRPGIPRSSVSGVAAIITELRATVDETLLGKAAGGDTHVTPLTVNGGRGFWLDGAPHFFFYRDASGTVLSDTLRLAGNTLVWEQDGVTLRLEASITRDQALEVAAGLR